MSSLYPSSMAAALALVKVDTMLKAQPRPWKKVARNIRELWHIFK